MDTVAESEASSSNNNNSECKNIGEVPGQSEQPHHHGAESHSNQTREEDNQATECSGGDGTIQEGETTDKREKVDTQTCMLPSFDSCKPVIEIECQYRMDEANVNEQAVDNAEESERSACYVDVNVQRASLENESESRDDHLAVGIERAGLETEKESRDDVVDVSVERVGPQNESESSRDASLGGERAGLENAERAELENESESRDCDVDAGNDRARAESRLEDRTVDHGEENRENRSDGAALPDENKDDDKEKTAGDADKSNDTIDESKARNWSKKEVQDLLIKAINFRAPMRDVQTILRCGVEVNAAVKNGLNPLHYAAYCDNDASVEILLNAGANVNATDDIGYTPLHLCARRGNQRTMKVLIENGSMINFNELGKEIRQTEETNKLGYTTTEPLNLAIQNLHPKCTKLLLENGARPNNKYFMGTEVCLAPLDDVECLELLLQFGADPNVFNRCGLSPLMKACKDHHISAVRLLIKYKADINALCPPLFEQKSVLQFAIMSGNIVIINILLQKGAIITRQGEYNFSALHTAAMRGRADICRILLQYGADANERTAEGATALMLACCTPELKERREIVALLIDCGADVNAYSPTYSFFDPYLAPLTEYMKNIENTEEFSIVDTLVRHGAEVHFSSSGLDRELRRLRDPFSILPYSHCLENYPDMFNMLVNLSNKYCPLLIHANEKLSEEKKDALLYIGTRPRELKHQVRIMLRQNLSPGLPENVEKLPLPSILKKYVMVK